MERYNLVVIGAGSGGLVVAAGGSGLGARVALAEKHALPFTPEGGTPSGRWAATACSTAACPRRRSSRAAKAAHAAREAGRFAIRGVSDPGPQDLGAVMDYVRHAQAHIAPADSVERFKGLGVDVLLGAGRLKSAHEVEVERHDRLGKARRHRDGLARARSRRSPASRRPATSRTKRVFAATKLPGSLLVMGGGPIGTELGQAFSRLGLEGHDRVVHPAHLPEGGRRRRGRPREAS